MGRNLQIAAAVVSVCLIAGSTASANPSWVGAPYSLSIPSHISGRGQSVSSSVNLTLDHDILGCNVYFSADGDAYLLKNGSNSLTTKYKLTGTSLDHQDANWIDADQFATPSNAYSVSGTGTSTLTLYVQATEPGAPTPVPAGDYTATLTVTVTWP